MGLGKGKTGNEIVSYLGKGTEVTGDITFTSGMRIDGVIKGKIRSEASLIIGPSGSVDAEVSVRNVAINGEFRGIIRAADRVEIHKDGKVFGDIYTPCLIIEAGATFEGRCNMNETAAPEPTGSVSPHPSDTDSVNMP
jgi:cytoskeletal protein CcmA (bactofilin family)